MKKILNILLNPSKELRVKSKKIDTKNIDKTIKKLAKNLELTMRENNGIGLAAPQTGNAVRLIVIRYEEGIKILINPEIIKKSRIKEWDEEGCLSVPNTYGKVRRNKKISCIYLDLKGKKQKIQANGLLARVIQHEIDHLDGVLFIDKAKEIQEIKTL